jgi:hypothetical protein
MVFTVKPLLVPSLEERFEREIKEVAMWMGLDVDTTDDFSLSCT